MMNSDTHIICQFLLLRLAKNILISNLGMTKTLMRDMSSSSSTYKETKKERQRICSVVARVLESAMGSPGIAGL